MSHGTNTDLNLFILFYLFFIYTKQKMADNSKMDSIVQIAVPAAGAYMGYMWADSLTELLPMVEPAQPWLATGLGLYIGFMLVPTIEGFYE